MDILCFSYQPCGLYSCRGHTGMSSALAELEIKLEESNSDSVMAIDVTELYLWADVISVYKSVRLHAGNRIGLMAKLQ